MVKSKLPPQGGCSLEAVEPHYRMQENVLDIYSKGV